MSFACLQVGQLLARRQSGLNAAEGLELEEHLATCASCRTDANLLQGLTRLASETPTMLSETARQRAIASALTTASSISSRAKRTTTGARGRGLLLTAAAAAILCTWFVAREQRSASPAPVASTATQPTKPSLPATAAASGDSDASKPRDTADRVVSGRVELANASLAAGDSLPAHTPLHTIAAASIKLAHARIELHAESQASWDDQARKLSLPQGSALIEVDPTRHQSFEVETSTFIVAVLGTRFEVTQSSVEVLRGRVSVQPKASSPGAAPLVLAAGSKRSRFELPPTAASPQRSAASTERTHRAARSSSEAADRSQPESSESASELLERARAMLAARRQQEARHALELAKPKLLDDGSRAQALSLEAECEQQAHRFSSARDTYLAVVQRFPQLPAAETALFAAARIEAEHGQANRAKQLLSQYLARYPGGSFAREASLRLRKLEHDAAAERAP